MSETEKKIPKKSSGTKKAHHKVKKNSAADQEKRIMARKRRKRSKIYSAIYYSFLALTVVALFGFFIYASGVVRDWVTGYEASQPIYQERIAARPFLERDYRVLSQCEDPAIFENESYEKYESYMHELLDGRTITYSEVRSGDENLKSYVVMADENIIGEFHLRHTGNDPRFGFWIWQVDSLDTDVLVSTKYTVEAPETATVYVDGKPLTEEDITIRGIPEFETVELPSGASVPSRCVYEFERYFGVSEVTCEDRYGEDCDMTQDGREYSAAFHYDDSRMAEALDERVTEVVRRLTCFMSNDYALRQLKKDMIDGCSAEKKCEAFDLRWILDHRGYEFYNMDVRNYVSYGEKCFSVETRYDFQVIYKRSDPQTYPTAYRLYFQKDGDEWKLFDFELI